METRKITAPYNVRHRLAELGLTLDVLSQALRMGFVARSNCTSFDPIQTPGTQAWSYVIRGLREQLIASDSRWTKADPNGLPLIINERLGICITAETGDRATGLPHLNPKQKNPKGRITELATRVNSGQIELFPKDYQDNELAGLPNCVFWVLLISIDDDRIRAELSQPANMDGGKTTFWLERIILPEIVPDAAALDSDNDDLGPDIEVTVQRKGGR